MKGPPDFSIAIETLNLSHEPIERFRRMLESLANQTLPPRTAREVVVVDSGEADPKRLRSVCAEYDWVTVMEAGRGISYDRAKFLGVESTKGRIIVFADSDCVYEPQWLESILEPFASPEVQVVAGETSTEIRGAYSLAMAMTCCFPRFSCEERLGEAEWYEFNNVAMRRELLERVPFPAALPTPRGCGFLHALALNRAGVRILRQPKARGLHPIARGVGHFTEHFLERGMESACASLRLGDRSGKSYRSRTRLGRVMHKARQALAEDRRRWILLPLALPVAAASVVLYGIGRIRGLRASPHQASPSVVAEGKEQPSATVRSRT